MGFYRGLAALALTAGAPAASAQEPHPLAWRAAELREADAGSLAEVRAAANELLVLLRENTPEEARIPWPGVAVDLCEAFDSRGAPESAAYLAWELGVALRTAGDLTRARELLLRHVPHLEGARHVGAALVFIELADFERYAGRWAAAWEHLARARAVLVPSGVEPGDHEPEEREPALALGTWFDVAGQYFLELGRSDLAAAHFAEQRERALALSDDALWWGAVDNQVRLAFAAGRLEAVVSLCVGARDEPFWTRGIAGDRAKLDLEHGRALVELEARGERPRGGTRELLLAVLENEGAQEHDHLDAEILLATEALDAHEPMEAREWLASARARRPAEVDETSREAFALEALALRLARVGPADEARAALQRAQPVFERFLSTWASTPILAGGVGFLQSDWRAQFLEQLALLELELRGEVEGARALAERSLRAQACGTLTRAQGAPVVDLETVRELFLREGRGALVLLPGRSQSLALALDANATRVFELGAAHELFRARERLEEGLLGVIGDWTSASEKKLEGALERATAAFLPAPLWQAIRPWKEIVVVGAEGSGLSAFELLEPEESRALGVIRAVTHVPSLPIAVALVRARRTPRGERGVVVVAPAEKGGRPAPGELPPIPYDRDHAQALLELHGRERSLLLARDAATVAALRLQDFGAKSAASFVTHGLYDPTRERPAGLLLAGGEALWCEEVETLCAPALVSLVACGAGRGPVRRGDDGRAGLGAAFLRAGAETVILGDADLELRLGLFLDQVLHTRLCAGDSPAEALRAARAAVLDAGFGREDSLQALLVRVHGLGGEPLLAPERARDAGEDKGSRALILLALSCLTLLSALLLGLFLHLTRRRRRNPER